MASAEISINQLAYFVNASDAKRRGIIKQQKKVNPVKIAWYRTAKAAIKLHIAENGSISPIDKGIKALQDRKPKNKQQENDNKVSIEALETMKSIEFPKRLYNQEYEVIRPKLKSVEVHDVKIIIAPDIVYQVNRRGKNVLGGVKIHISKNEPFDSDEAKFVAFMIEHWLMEVAKVSGESVEPNLCLCLDVFAERYMPAPNASLIAQRLSDVCADIKTLWTKI